MASGKKVIANVGGDLNIESLQDTNTYKVDEKSLGIGISLCIPPFCYGMSSISGASPNFGATNIYSNYASVTEQSGIKAGDDGFDINVRGNTDLVGGVIASSDRAVQDGKNSLVTSNLTSRDIKNKADYDANTVSLGGGLFSQTSPDESEEQREAKRNLIVSLVTGLATTSASIDPTTANTAAGAAVDNNWLATQQIVQFKKEYDEAKGLIAAGKVVAKWSYISGRQDVLTQFGIGKGLAQSGWNDVTGLAEFVAHPIEGLTGLGQLINNPEARKQFGDSVVNELNVKIETIKTALEVGGDENAEALGKAIGEIAWQVGSIATGVGGAAKGGVALAKAGIKVGAQQLEKMVVDGVKLAKIEASKTSNALPHRPVADAPETTPTRTPDELAGNNKPTTDAPNTNEKPETPPNPDKAVPAMDEFTVKAFNPFSSDKFKAMTPEQQKSFLKEYNKQLLAQQNAINRMTVEEFKTARGAYDKLGRNPDAAAAQQKFGKDFENEVRDSITESLMTKGTDFKTASAQAAVRAREIRSELAALHDPDMVAGGWFSHEPVRMGDSLINSSIGGSWPSRLKALDEAVSSAIANGSGQAKMNVRLELLRGRGN